MELEVEEEAWGGHGRPRCTNYPTIEAPMLLAREIFYRDAIAEGALPG
jgi:hypothetical protein